MPCRGPATSSPSRSATMRPSARACGSCWSGRVLLRSQSPPRRRTAFTACTTSLSSPVSSSLQGHQILAINRGEKEKILKRHRPAGSGAGAAAAAAGRGEARLRGHGICQRLPRRTPMTACIFPSLEREVRGGTDGAGQRGRHRPVCPEPEAPADAAAGKGQGHHGAGPRLPHGLQGGGGGRHRQGAGYRRGLSHLRRAAEAGGHRRAGEADRASTAWSTSPSATAPPAGKRSRWRWS